MMGDNYEWMVKSIGYEDVRMNFEEHHRALRPLEIDNILANHTIYFPKVPKISMNKEALPDIPQLEGFYNELIERHTIKWERNTEGRYTLIYVLIAVLVVFIVAMIAIIMVMILHHKNKLCFKPPLVLRKMLEFVAVGAPENHENETAA